MAIELIQIRIQGDNTHVKAALAETDRDIAGLATTAKTMSTRMTSSTTDAAKKMGEGFLGLTSTARRLFDSLGQGVSSRFDGMTTAAKNMVENMSLGFKLAASAGAGLTAVQLVQGIQTLIMRTLDYATNISDLSARMNVSVEAAQRWKFAADQTGSSLETVSSSVLKLSDGLAGGNKGLKQSLTAAGLSFDAIRAMKPEDAFNRVVEAIGNVPDPMRQADIAMQAFGSSGAALLPAIREGFVNLALEASVMSAATVRALSEAQDAWAKLQNEVVVASGGILAEALKWKEFHDLLTLSPGKMREVAADAVTAYGQLGSMVDGARQALQQGMLPAIQSAAEAQKEFNRVMGTPEEQRKHVEALLQRSEAIQKLADTISGAKATEQLRDLAEAFGRLTPAQQDAAAASVAFAKRLDGLRDAGGQLGQVFSSILDQAERNAAGWASLIVVFQALTQAKKDGIAIAQDYLDKEIAVAAGLLQARQGLMTAALATSASMRDAVMKDSMSAADYAIYQAERQRDETLAALEPLRTALPLIYENARQNTLIVYANMVNDAKVTAQNTLGAFATGLANLPMVIMGALQSGVSVAQSVGASLGAALFGPGSALNTALNGGISKLATKVGGDFAAKLAHSLSMALPGIGALIGPALVSLGGKIVGWVGGLFGGGNDTKSDREKLAGMLGFGSLAEMNSALIGMGEEGAALVHQGLNVIGKKDTAANNAWMQSVRDLFAAQATESAAAATAVEDAARRESEAQRAVQDAIQEKIDVLDSERASVFSSIREELENPEYDEAGNRIYGVIEAQGIARLAEIDKQKAELDIQMAEASAKVMDEATIVKDGIWQLFSEPIKLTFDLSDLPAGFGPTGSPGNTSYAAMGGWVTPEGVKYYDTGGWVRRGSDTVPAMLTPGEFVVSRKGVAALSALNRGDGGGFSGRGGTQHISVKVGQDTILDTVVYGLKNKLELLGVR